MRCRVEEYDHAFYIELAAESVEDAAVLARMKMNSLPRTCAVETRAEKTSIQSSVSLDKVKPINQTERVRTLRGA